MRSTEVLRLFIAIALPDEVVSRLEAEQEALRAASLPIRWVKPRGIHLTLQFLGDVAAHRTNELLTALKKAADGCAPFSLKLDGLGAFPNLKRPRVLWVGVGGDQEPLFELQSRIVSAMKRRGFVPEKRAFSPHLTLGRVRQGVDREALERIAPAVAARPPIEGPSWEADSVSLIRSELLPSGAQYTTLGVQLLEEAR